MDKDLLTHCERLKKKHLRVGGLGPSRCRGRYSGQCRYGKGGIVVGLRSGPGDLGKSIACAALVNGVVGPVINFRATGADNIVGGSGLNRACGYSRNRLRCGRNIES